MSLHLYIACHCLAVARKHYDAADASSTPNHATQTLSRTHACRSEKKQQPPKTRRNGTCAAMVRHSPPPRGAWLGVNSTGTQNNCTGITGRRSERQTSAAPALFCCGVAQG